MKTVSIDVKQFVQALQMFTEHGALTEVERVALANLIQLGLSPKEAVEHMKSIHTVH